ncbi:MAG: hypothetical protein LUD73_03085 [Lachnospiraceae bacterium]|nr:hypothetical protein [Lachnospiraceae bacterium]
MQITIEGKPIEVPEGMSYLELSRQYQKNYSNDIVLVLENGSKMRELFRPVKEGACVEFLTTASADGFNTYRRSATLLL